jgi:3-hydroxyisobutyrate dehydrogenase
MEAVAMGEEGIVAGLRPGSIYIDLTTTSPTSIELVSAAVVAKGALMVDAPVMGDRASIGELQHLRPYTH